jgi:hypothetical protein
MMAASRFLRSAVALSPDEEDAFFSGIRTANGTFKTTGRGRLDAVNDLFFSLLEERRLTPRTVHDLGISSGVTTLEWLRAFERRGMCVSMLASDLNLTAYLATLGAGVTALVDPVGHVLQLEFLGLGIRAWHRRRDRVTGSILWRRPLLAWAERRLGQRAPGGEGPYLLVTPAVRHDPSVTLVEEDILVPPPPERVGSADVVRVANLLQSSYFSAGQLAAAVRCVRDRLHPGSLLILCRNEGDSAAASILGMGEDGRLGIEARLGKGSEIEALFLE